VATAFGAIAPVFHCPAEVPVASRDGAESRRAIRTDTDWAFP
jgi:hypothetical protein